MVVELSVHFELISLQVRLLFFLRDIYFYESCLENIRIANADKSNEKPFENNGRRKSKVFSATIID